MHHGKEENTSWRNTVCLLVISNENVSDFISSAWSCYMKCQLRWQQKSQWHRADSVTYYWLLICPWTGSYSSSKYWTWGKCTINFWPQNLVHWSFFYLSRYYCIQQTAYSVCKKWRILQATVSPIQFCLKLDKFNGQFS